MYKHGSMEALLVETVAEEGSYQMFLLSFNPVSITIPSYDTETILTKKPTLHVSTSLYWLLSLEFHIREAISLGRALWRGDRQ
jgi:hypothetical protein